MVRGPQFEKRWFKRTMVVYFENTTKHENSLREQSAGFLNVKVGGNSKHCVLNS